MSEKKKTYLALQKVREFIAEQSEESQIEYLNLVKRLEQDGYLIQPFAKKLDTDIFEIRIR